MDWTTVDFTDVTTEIEAMIPEIVPPLLLLFGLILAVKFIPKLASRFGR